MGTYGDFTGVVLWFDEVNQVGHQLVLEDGEPVSDITGQYWASGAIGFDQGNGFWLDRIPITKTAGSPVGLLLALTHAASGTSPGITRLFFGNSAGNKVTWDGNALNIVGTLTATDGEIGGWTIGATALYADGTGASDSAGMSPSDYPFYAGALYANRASAAWRITPAGKMYIQGTVYLSQAGGYSLVIGEGWATEPAGDYGAYIGYQAGNSSNEAYCVAIGYRAGSGAAFGPYSTAIGAEAGLSSTGGYTTLIGRQAGYNSTYSFTVAIGDEAGSGVNATGYSVFVGSGAALNAAFTNAVAIGSNAGKAATSGANDSVLVGANAGYGATGKTVAVGHEAAYNNSGAGVIAFGYRSGYNNTYNKVILFDAAATADQQIVFGSVSLAYLELYGGGGVASDNAPYFRVNATGGSGTNKHGGDLKLAGGAASGNAASGSVIIQTAPAGSSGSTQQTLADRIKVDPSGNTYIGDGGNTNYSQFDNTGHLTMTGTAKPWDDLRIEPVARTTGTNAPTFEKWYDDSGGSSRGVYLYSFDDAAAGSEKEVFFTMQMPHSWDGGDIYIHVHWVGAVADTTATPRWGLEYIWAEPGAAYGDSTIVYATGNHLSEADITAHKHYITAFAAISPGTGADGLSSVLIGRLFRNSSDAADTYNAAGAKVGLLYIDGHYQLARLGSTDEYTA